MTTIYYEYWPVARLADQNGLSLTYDAAWEKRASAFPLSLTMPLRAGSHGPEQVMPWLANLLPETHLSEIGQQVLSYPASNREFGSSLAFLVKKRCRRIERQIAG